MALKATQRSTATRFALEDVFVAGDADKLAWVSGWRKLPHVPRDVAKLFDYPQQFAEEVFARIEAALDRDEERVEVHVQHEMASLPHETSLGPAPAGRGPLGAARKGAS